MRLLGTALWSTTIAGIYAAPREALVYLSDHSPADIDPPSITPHEARLLLAQRLGLSQYHSLGDVEESTLEFLNTYGGPSTHLFSEKQWDDGPRRVLAIVEGVQHPEGTTALENHLGFVCEHLDTLLTLTN